MNNGPMAGTVAQRMPQVMEQTDRLEKALVSLSELRHDLSERLRPALRPCPEDIPRSAPPSILGTVALPGALVRCPLAERLSELAAQTESACSHLSRLISELEL